MSIQFEYDELEKIKSNEQKNKEEKKRNIHLGLEEFVVDVYSLVCWD